MLKISVAIPTHNRADKLHLALQSCCEQSFAADEFEVLVIGNLPCADTKAVVNLFSKKIQNLHYHCIEQENVNIARNKALDEAKAEIIYFIDDDCQLDNKDQLSKIYELHKRHQTIVAIGGGYQSQKKSSLICQLYNKMVNRWLKWHRYCPKQVCLPGGNASYKMKHLDSQRFYTEFVDGGEETEFNLRLQKLGLQVLHLESLNIAHSFSFSWRRLPQKAYNQGVAKAVTRAYSYCPPSINRKRFIFRNVSALELGFLTYYLSFVFLGQLSVKFKTAKIPLLQAYEKRT